MKSIWIYLCCLLTLPFLWACGPDCERDADCPSGNYCGKSQACQKECRLHSDCDLGKTCSSTGRCVASATINDASVVREEAFESGKELEKDGFEENHKEVRARFETKEESNKEEPREETFETRKEEVKEETKEEFIKVCNTGDIVPCYEQPIQTLGKGVCRSGKKSCIGGIWSACLGQVVPSIEVCDNKDNDCDGKVDEYVERKCGAAVGECSEKKQQCKSGKWGACSFGRGPKKEVCDGLDNDCDGQTDEGCPDACQLVATPSKLSFDKLLAGESKKLSLKVENRGKKVCTIRTIKVNDVSPTNHGRFQVSSKKSLPKSLSPGDSFSMEVAFSPISRGYHTSTLELGVPEKKDGIVVVSLSGIARGDCLLKTHSQLDFGSIKSGCASRKVSFSLHKVYDISCPNTIELKNVTLEQGSGSAFQLKTTAAFPFKLGFTSGGAFDVSFDISFQPTSTGTKNGALVFKHNIPNEPDIRIPLVGEGSTSDSQKDVFTQTIAKPDILFIVDDSAGMTSKQQILSKNFPAFMASAIQSNADYQLAATTTSSKKIAGCFVGKTKIIKPTTKDAAKVFEQNVIGVGTGGDSTERALDSAYLALHPDKLNDPKCNQGFLRKGAFLSLIFVSDENEQSSNTTDFYIKYFHSLKGKHQLKKVVVSSIVKHHLRVPRFTAITKAFGGAQGDINTKDWSNVLSTISKHTLSIANTFFLRHAADETSIVVHVNNKAVAKSNSDGWRFDNNENTIIFSGSKIPAAGDSILVEYKALCKP